MRRVSTLFLLLSLLTPMSPSVAQSTHSSNPLTQPNKAVPSASNALAKLPTSFIANAGQLDSNVRFEVRSSAGHLFFTPQGVTLALAARSKSPKPIDDRSIALRHIPSIDTTPQTNVAVRVSFDGANPNVILGGADQQPGMVNFFIGNDPAQWHTNVPTFAGVTYHDLYPGIDLTYNGHGGALKGTYTVAPGADPTLIRWHYDGATATRLDPTSGDLLIDAADGLKLTEQVPEVWQTDADGVQLSVAARYALAVDGAAQFTLGTYDPALPLVIDPGLVYSTYLGGSSSDRGYGIAIDSSSNAYITGETDSDNFPTTVGALQTTLAGSDAFVVKLNATGTGLVYSTYLSGVNSGDSIKIAVDSSGNAYITGFTQSTNFPTTRGAFQTIYGGLGDAFVVKLNTTGSGLLYSTYLGGSDVDEGAGIAIDSSGNAYITGFTQSTNFPTTAGAFQTTLAGPDAFVVKLNATGSELLYSTYLGGSDVEVGFRVAVDSSGNAYVLGWTISDNFPTTVGAFQTVYGGLGDAFVVKLNTTGSGLLYSTFLGGTNGDDKGYGIAVDSSGSAYVTGYTQSTNFPTTVGAFQTVYSSYDAFVVKLNANGTGLIYGTYLGGSNVDVGYGIAVDSSGNAYVTGEAGLGFPTTVGAFQTTFGGGGGDAFVVKLSATGNALAYSTYLGGGVGGSNVDVGYGIAVDSSGSAYVTGEAGLGFPTTVGAFQMMSDGNADAFITKLDLIPLGLPTTYFSVTGFPSPIVAGTAGTVTVQALDASNNATNNYTGTVHLTSSDLQAILPANATLTNGVGTFSVTLKTGGTQSITATDTITNTITGTQSGIVVNQAPAITSANQAIFHVGSAGTFTVTATGTPAPMFSATGLPGWTTLNPTTGVLSGTPLTTVGSPFSITITVSNGVLPNATQNFTLTVAAGAIDTIGVFRPSTATFYLRNSNTTGAANITTAFGTSTDLPVVGDWNGDGIDTVGVYRTGQFLLRDSNTSGASIVYNFALGVNGDVPMAGDWDGDGKDGVGVFRPSNGLIYLKNGLTTGFANFQMVLGVPGDVPVAGDWNHDGKDSPGVYRPSSTTFFLTDQVCNCNATGSYQATLGVAGDSPIAGDWNNDGSAGIAVFRPSNGLIYLKNTPTTGYADIQIVFGIPNDKPVAGHWFAGPPTPPKLAPTFVP
ncbi:MAG: SBBP repeat-containing protein [Chloroflexota bacterium]